jgi:formimidoylglutamate deiminase
MKAIRADYTYLAGKFEPDVAIVFDPGSGSIVQVTADALPAGIEVERLAGRALLPGMVNAHSHTFQRAIRGWTQWRPADEKADFWSWREAMYRAVQRFTPEDLYAVSLFCFIEMLLAGYSTVGEFHYLQRDADGSPYGDPNELALQVVRAARDAGIRIVLLNSCYVNGDVEKPLRPEQRRFATPDLDQFLTQTDALRAAVREHELARTGLAPHSVRAVPRAWLKPLAEYARARHLPLHMHVSEQPAEVEACVQRHRRRPVELLSDEGVLDVAFTAVHATHLSELEVQALGQAGARVCACPTTERDLGDGIPRSRDLAAAGVQFCVGSDSQTVIDPWEEIRLIEYNARLSAVRRLVLAEPIAPDRWEVAHVLLRAGSTNGAAALGLGATGFAAGDPADLIAIDLDHPTLAGWTRETLAAAAALSAPSGIVRDVWVGGRHCVKGGCHQDLIAAQQEFSRVCKRVLA